MVGLFAGRTFAEMALSSSEIFVTRLQHMDIIRANVFAFTALYAIIIAAPDNVFRNFIAVSRRSWFDFTADFNLRYKGFPRILGQDIIKLIFWFRKVFQRFAPQVLQKTLPVPHLHEDDGLHAFPLRP